MTTIANIKQRTGNSVDRFLDILRCPITGATLRHEQGALVSLDRTRSYRLGAAGVPLFAEHHLSAEATSQRHHYNKIAAAYTANLGYPHTREYLAYLDRAT